MSKPLIDRVYPERAFGGYSRVDGIVEFYGRVQSLLKSNTQVLDIGCGRGKYAEDVCAFRRRLTTLGDEGRHVLGIDVDQAGAENRMIDQFRPIEDVARWPVDDGSIDLAVANAVMEHVEQPDEFFREAHRVLRPGGVLCVRTFNKWNYVGIAARLIPNRHHGRVLGRVQEGRKQEDVFPTLYRCNTRGALGRAMRAAGFESHVYSHESEPSYLHFSPLLYRVGAVMHRLTPPMLRWALHAFGRKRDA